MNLFLTLQLELDAEALERMDELTIQAKEEQAATERERARLEVSTVGNHGHASSVLSQLVVQGASTSGVGCGVPPSGLR